MSNQSTENAAGGARVYREIKARVIARDFEPGKPICLSSLARQLAAGTTPVCEALNKLAAQGLVSNKPNEGFITTSLSSDRLLGLYHLNRVLLDEALSAHSPEVELTTATITAVAAIGTDLDQREQHNADTIADYTGQLFCCIAALTGNSHIVESADRVNDSLHYIRTLECQLSQNVPVELIRICEPILAGQFDELRTAVADYHDNRLALLPDLMDLLRQ